MSEEVSDPAGIDERQRHEMYVLLSLAGLVGITATTLGLALWFMFFQGRTVDALTALVACGVECLLMCAITASMWEPRRRGWPTDWLCSD